MEKLLFCAPTMFGLEGIARDELKRMGMQNVAAEEGRVLFEGNLSDAATALVRLRTAERVQIVAADFAAHSFDDLFEGVKAVEWERFIPKGCAFPVRGHCVDSTLMSVPDCTSIIRKAIAVRLGAKYHTERLDESRGERRIRFTILRDRALVHVDLAGDPLYKRGYRTQSGEAPLRETLAAGLVLMMPWFGREPFRDPMCGSGTIALEAAMIAKNRAPGLMRRFSLEAWEDGERMIADAKESARAKEFSREYDIAGSDIDKEVVELARSNARRAGLDGVVRFEVADAREFSHRDEKGCVVCNPPYGVRLGDGIEAADLIKRFGAAMREKPNWCCGILTADPELEQWYGAKAGKRRRMYNGMIQCTYYRFLPNKRG